MKASYVTIAAIVLSLIILVIITSVTGVNPAVLLSIAPVILLAAIGTVVVRLMLMALRFNFIINSFSDRKYPFFESLAVRLGSEFVALTSLAYVGGEVARAAWMVKNGEVSGRALWLPYIEIVFDVYAGNGIALIAGLYALQQGELFLGGVVLAVSLVILSFVTGVVILSHKGMIRMPTFLSRPLRWVVGEIRAQSLMEKGNVFLSEFCVAANNTFTRRNGLKLLIVGIYTFFTVLLTGATLWLVSLGFGLHLSFLDCAPTVYASIVLGNLPITLGGSGVAEAGVYFYSSYVFGVSSWPMVFAWRIISYHFVLIVTGACAFFILRRYTK